MKSSAVNFDVFDVDEETSLPSLLVNAFFDHKIDADLTLLLADLATCACNKLTNSVRLVDNLSERFKHLALLGKRRMQQPCVGTTLLCCSRL